MSIVSTKLLLIISKSNYNNKILIVNVRISNIEKIHKTLKLKNLKNEFSVSFHCQLSSHHWSRVSAISWSLQMFSSSILWILISSFLFRTFGLCSFFFFFRLIWKIVMWNWIIRERFKFDMNIVFTWRSRWIINRIEKYVGMLNWDVFYFKRF